LKVTVSK